MKLKLIISAVALAAITLHMRYPQLNFDQATLALFVIGVMPWLTSVFKSIELPFFKVTAQEIKAASDAILKPANEAATVISTPIVTNARVGLIELRSEIEERIRRLSALHGLPFEHRPLRQLIHSLHDKQVLKASQADGLMQLVSAGNAAAHAKPVDDDAAVYLTVYGPNILKLLDQKLARGNEGK